MLPLIPLLPLFGFLSNAGLGRRVSKALAAAIACGAMLASLAISVIQVQRLLALPPDARTLVQETFTWIDSGDLHIGASLKLDPLSAVMILVVTGVGFLIHVYSIAYMKEERDAEYARYFSYLNLFAAFMLVLVLASNFLVMFVGWEGVGLCSYLLIGFWFEKKSAADAGKKAFIVNRIGDFGFILGVLLVYVRFGTLDVHQIARALEPFAPETAFGTLSLITLLLFIGATGKSAQIPLYVWLPDAMEGPTPVSALIHAATMVTAGVYMIGRNAVLFSHAPQTLSLVAVIGAATALVAGTIGLVQHDIKRVLAYSTVSQLGYMFLAMGVGAYAAGIFHLYTHAFFKALLFLGSGAVIHALAGQQDLRQMGGLRQDLPITYWTFLAGACAISGVPLLSGFFSKDEILFQTYARGHALLWAVGLSTALLTAVYMFRLVFLAFHGTRDHSADGPAQPGHLAPHGAGAHLGDPPLAMSAVLVMLAVGAVGAGYVGLPRALGGTNRLARFLAPSFAGAAAVQSSGLPRAEDATDRAAERVPEGLAGGGAEGAAEAAVEGLELGLMAVSTVVALAGIGLAVFFFLTRRSAADRAAARFPGLYRLLSNKYYVDEIYDGAIVQPVRFISELALWRGLDVRLIDGAVNNVAVAVTGASRSLRRLQTGSVRAYAASLFLGVVLILGYYLLK